MTARVIVLAGPSESGKSRLANKLGLQTYSLAANRAGGSQPFSLQGADFVVVEGLFASAVITPIEDAGQLAAAVVPSDNSLVTFLRRTRRDFADDRRASSLASRSTLP